MKLATTALERAAILVASLALSFGLIALLSGFFAGRDQAGVGGSAIAPIGERFADLGHAHLRPGQLRPSYNSEPPTSGAHIALPVRRDGVRLNDDQVLEALELGDVVVAYGAPHPPAALRSLQSQISGPFTPQLAAAGQAIILDRRPGTHGVLALAWTRLFLAPRPADPRLHTFAQQWLGHGAAAG